MFVSARQRERLSEFLFDVCLFKIVKIYKVLSSFFYYFYFLTTCQQPCAVWGVVLCKLGETDGLIGKDMGMAADNGKDNDQGKGQRRREHIEENKTETSGIMQKRQQ